MASLVTKVVSPKNVNISIVQHETQRSNRRPHKYWRNQENIDKFLSEIKQKYNFNTPKEWNSFTQKHVKSNGGIGLLLKYSMYELKCMACPEGKSIFKEPKQPSGYWKNSENIDQLFTKLKEKYNLKTPEDWNSITTSQIQSNGGRGLLSKYSLFELKCMACPEGKSIFNSPPQITGFWENKENVGKFLEEIKKKFNLNTPEDWNSITKDIIISNGGGTLATKYSMYELKCLACPEGKFIFNNPKKESGYWEDKENIDKFLLQLKEKYNLNSPEDWNSITLKLIQSNGGGSLLLKYSLYDLKCLACPEGKSSFYQMQAPGFWENKENIKKFLYGIQEKYNLQTPEDWNSITREIIQSNGGRTLINKYSIYELKCLACPEGKSFFGKTNHEPGYWENKENIEKFFVKLKEKYNLNTPEDWNSITTNHIQSNGGRSLLAKHSMYELKCMACPEGKLIFSNPRQVSGYWENKENVRKFLEEIKQKYHLQSIDDWNSINHKHIQSNGGSRLLSKYSMYELKCLGCPEGKDFFNFPNKVQGYWENKENIDKFVSQIKKKYNLNTPNDWKRVSKFQIKSDGGWWLFNNQVDVKIQFDSPNKKSKFIPLSKLISGSCHKRSSQRWLFLQIKKLFPNEEMVEDYFHSEISMSSGANVQFDIFMIERNIAIEYHGKQHYEDIPSGFSGVETYQYRDLEKEKLCKEYGIQLIVIPYWWDNRLDSLRTYLYSKINL